MDSCVYIVYLVNCWIFLSAGCSIGGWMVWKEYIVLCILYLCLVSSCEYPLILVFTLASTQLCRLTAWFLFALVILISDRASGDLRGSGVLFGGLSSFPFYYVLFYSRTRH